MAVRFNIELLGNQRLQQQLRTLTERVERKVLQEAIRTGVRQVVLPAVRAVVPVGKPSYRIMRRKKRGQLVASSTRSLHPGGRLKATLRPRALRRQRRRVGYGLYTGTKEQLGLQFVRGYYPAHVEYGYKTRSGRKIPARKYMKNPLRATQGHTLAVIAAAIRAGIEREVRP